MGIRLDILLNRKILVFSSLSGLVLFIALFSLPNLFAASLKPEQAERWIRHYLKMKLAQEYVEQVKKSGFNPPDAVLAEQWNKDIRKSENVVFESIEVSHFLIAPPTSSTRIYVVKTVIKGKDEQRKTRYFSLTSKNRFFDFFWVNEHSRWMWLFSF